MWYYKKETGGYKIIKKNELNFTIPYRQEVENTIIIWDDHLINKLVNDLNDGNILFHMNTELQNKNNQIGFDFNLEIPKGYLKKNILKKNSYL